MQAYFQMALTVLLSLLGSTMLKLSDGFTNIQPTLIFIVSYCFAFYFFALVGRFYFHEALGVGKIIALIVIIIGIILINNSRLPVNENEYYERVNHIIR